MTERLKEYNEKRDFATTLEPEGKTDYSGEKLRFAVQHHIARSDHYDLRLEWQGTLLSWAVPKGPSFNTRDKRLAIQVEDHPLEYRNFEGIIPKGEYGGGVVMLWDEGWWEPRDNVAEGLRKGSLKFVLKGKRLQGKWALVRMKPKDGETKINWLWLKEKDEYAQQETGIFTFTTSIRTDRSMEEIEAGAEARITRNPFNRADIQQAKLVTKVPEGDDWLYEMKFDGYRIMAFVEGNNARLLTRNDNDYTRQFSDVATSLINLAAGRAMVLDGEMTITDPGGKTDFQALQNYMKNSQGQNLTYIVFDLLALDGVDLRGRPLIDRKETLAALLQDAPPNIYYSRHVIGNKGKESFLAACAAGMEGIIGKKIVSLYNGTRNGDWIKLKCEQRQDFVIGGYTLSDKRTAGISSLLLGVYEGEDFIYRGRVGTGFSERDRKNLEEISKSLQKAEPSFKRAPRPRSNEKITWLEPKLVADIKFTEWTEEQLLRQASFKGLRAGKQTRDSRELNNSIVIEGIKITNPDKVMFDEPEITKADVVRYYAKVAERMLPYVGHRVLSIVRCPKGIFQNCFYKKHPGPDTKRIVTIPVATGSGEFEDYFYIGDKMELIAEAQMGTLEFHIWGSRVDELEKPDIMVFDLDPDEGMELSRVRRGVQDMQSILAELSLNAYLKTSGGKGYHVVVPLIPSVSWDVFRDFARGVAEVMEQKWPDRYTSNVRKAKRTGKIFIDWMRNGRGATSIAPYSLRARKGAGVSMPIAWDELDTIAPNGIDMAKSLTRIGANDPWQDFFREQQMLK